MRTRSFIAVNLPSQLKDKIEKFEISFQKYKLPVRWIEKNNLHLTLRFLGHIEDKEIDLSKKILEKISGITSSFDLYLENLVIFPSLSAPRIIGLKIIRNKDLDNLFERVNNEFSPLKIGRDENRDFIPHITIGRVTDRVGDFHKLTNILFQDFFKVSSVELMKSLLSQSGAQYQIIQSFKFKK